MHLENPHLVASVSCSCIKQVEKPWSRCFWNKREECKETVKVLWNCTRKSQRTAGETTLYTGCLFHLQEKQNSEQKKKKKRRNLTSCLYKPYAFKWYKSHLNEIQIKPYTWVYVCGQVELNVYCGGKATVQVYLPPIVSWDTFSSQFISSFPTSIHWHYISLAVILWAIP